MVDKNSLRWLDDYTNSDSKGERWLSRTMKSLIEGGKLHLSPSHTLGSLTQDYGHRLSTPESESTRYAVSARFELSDGSLKLLYVTMRNELTKARSGLTPVKKDKIPGEQKKSSANDGREHKSSGSAKRARSSPSTGGSPTSSNQVPAAQRPRLEPDKPAVIDLTAGSPSLPDGQEGRPHHPGHVIDLTADNPPLPAPLPAEAALRELKNNAHRESRACAHALQGYVKNLKLSFGALKAHDIEVLNPRTIFIASSYGISDWPAVEKYCKTRRCLLEALGKSPDEVPQLFVNESNGAALTEDQILFRTQASHRSFRPSGPPPQPSSSSAPLSSENEPVNLGSLVSRGYVGNALAHIEAALEELVKEAESDSRVEVVARHTPTQINLNKRLLMTALVNGRSNSEVCRINR
ncbi:MAG TPA: hypothetical protein VIG66_00605, partial [Noviherbaspirillum sp.]